MRIIVAEKPSVARDLARVLGARDRRDGYFEGGGVAVSWCFGHLAELEDPAFYDPSWKSWSLATLPMVPTQFAIRARKGVNDQIAVLKRLLNGAGVDAVVNACDAGREGELIFRWLVELVGCTKPTLRLWTSSLTDSAIQDAWRDLRPGTRYDALGDAARSRSEADWLVGLNATRALTCSVPGGVGVLSVGRVQTPTLAMIVGRDDEIAKFVPEAFFTVRAAFSSGDARWEGRWFRETDEPEARQASARDGARDDEPGNAERLATREQAERVVAAASDQVGVVRVADRKRTREKPPLLYDLTSLQRRANQRFGFTAERTLQIAQDLYEKHKLITYPRTDARYLTPDQVPGLADVVAGLAPVAPYAAACAQVIARGIAPSSRVVDAAEVGDHHAIIPTGRTPDGGRLSPDEKRLFDLVARRFLAALSPDAVFDVTQLLVDVPAAGPVPEGVPMPLTFRARGRVCVDAGWREVDPPATRGRETDLPQVDAGAAAQCSQPAIHEGVTRPPPPLTDASLLYAMETAGRALDDRELKRAMRNAGLGTPATRASMITTLIDRGYVVRAGRDLRATEKGVAVISALPVEALKSAELTGRWEGRLAEIAEGRADRRAFMGDVVAYTTDIVRAIADAPPPNIALAADQPSLGNCPGCNQPVRERGPVFSCDSGRTCSFVVFKTMAKRAISARTVKQLLATGRSEALKGFKSKAGKPFDAGLMWDAEVGRVSMWFPETRSGDDGAAGSGGPPVPKAPPKSSPKAPPKARARLTARDASTSGGASAAKERPIAVGDRCPVCGQGRIIAGRLALGCDRWREGCGFRAMRPAP